MFVLWPGVCPAELSYLPVTILRTSRSLANTLIAPSHFVNYKYLDLRILSIYFKKPLTLIKTLALTLYKHYTIRLIYMEVSLN